MKLYDFHSTPFDFQAGAFLKFATSAALADYDDRLVENGGVVFVESYRDYFQKIVESPAPAAASGTIVPTSTGDGGWYRLGIASPTWASQAAWYIDPLTGDDENDGGTTGTALATWAEFTRRVRAVDLGMTVTILSNISEPLRGEFETSSSTSWLLITGEPTVLAYATGTACVNPVPATNTRGTLTTTDLTVSATGLAGSFVDYVGKFVRAPANDGYNHWPILRTSAANVAQGGFWAQDLNTAKPADNVRIEVLDLITAPTIDIVTNGLGVNARYFKFTSTATGDVVVLNPLRAQQSFRSGVDGVILNSAFTACEFSGTVHGYQSWFIACLFSLSATAATITAGTGSVASFNGGGSLRPIIVWNPGAVNFQGFVIQGAKLVIGATSASTQVQGAPAAVGALTGSTPLGVFDSPTDGVVVTSGASLAVNTLYGSGNAAYGCRVENGGMMRAIGTPTITGAGGTADLIFNGAATAIPPLTAAGAVPAASALTTWAHWVAAPFSRNVVSYTSGARISGA